jgi:hypothetical protein
VCEALAYKNLNSSEKIIYFRGYMTEKNKEITPLSEIKTSGIDVNKAITQANQMTDLLRKMKIKEATFETGAYFKHDAEAHTTVVATDGILINKGKHTTTVILRNEGSDEKQALDEVSTLELKQKELGSFSGKSQPWTSNQLNEDNDL